MRLLCPVAHFVKRIEYIIITNLRDCAVRACFMPHFHQIRG
jgi:hypothetical protein